MVFPKKSRWNMTFLVLPGKIMFLFPENMILHLRRKMKDDLSQKKTRNHYIFFKLSEKMVFSKKATPGHDLSCIIWNDGIFFPKTWYCSLGRKRAMTFLKKHTEIWYFCLYVRVLQTWCHAPLPKQTKDGLIPQKYT